MHCYYTGIVECCAVSVRKQYHTISVHCFPLNFVIQNEEKVTICILSLIWETWYSSGKQTIHLMLNIVWNILLLCIVVTLTMFVRVKLSWLLLQLYSSVAWDQENSTENRIDQYFLRKLDLFFKGTYKLLNASICYKILLFCFKFMHMHIQVGGAGVISQMPHTWFWDRISHGTVTYQVS